MFVLGGPGAGKGTACEFLVKEHGLVHLSAGDLLRAERKRQGSEFGELIESYIKDGKIVPIEITCKLLENAINLNMESGKYKFLIDGFPRNEENLSGWNKQMEGKVDLVCVIYMNCPLAVCESRILERAKSSGRVDDNIESLRKRFKTYQESTQGVIKIFSQIDKIREVDSSKDKVQVAQAVKEIIEKEFKSEMNGSGDQIKI